MKQIERIGVISLDLSGNTHHQHEVKKSMCSVARIPEAVERHLTQCSFDITIGDPLNSFAVEFRVGTMRAELARTT
jgi:hypothetical protein